VDYRPGGRPEGVGQGALADGLDLLPAGAQRSRFPTVRLSHLVRPQLSVPTTLALLATALSSRAMVVARERGEHGDLQT